MQAVTYNGIYNNTNELIQGFLGGKNYKLELSEKIFNTFSTLDNNSYIVTLKHIKKLLNNLEKEIFYNFFILRTTQHLLNEEKAVLVRFINICHKGNRNIIILNNDVLYVGSEYNEYKKQEIKEYIDMVMNKLRMRKNIIQFKQKMEDWKRKLFYRLLKK